MDRPFALLAELTYDCPLHCPYCSNPLALNEYRDELTTEEWQRVLAEAAELGVLQLHLSGGEPMQRHDIVELVQCANQLGLYTNLITSGLGFSTRRAEQLRDAGLDHVQVSIQADEQALSDRIAGTASFERKLVAARLVKQLGWPLTLNVVLHRLNIDRIGGILDMAEDLRCRPYRARQHAVLRLGGAQSRRAAAEQGPAGACAVGRSGDPGAARGPDGNHLRHPGLLQPLSETLHGRLGPPPAHCGAQRRRAAVPGRPRSGPWPRTASRQRARARPGVDLGRVPIVHAVPRRRVDAGSVPQLRTSGHRLRRLSLSGLRAHRRRRPHRPGLPPLRRPRARRGGGGGGQRPDATAWRTDPAAAPGRTGRWRRAVGVQA